MADLAGVRATGDVYKVGSHGITKITEYLPSYGMELHSYVIEYDDGGIIRVFNPNYIEYFTESN